MKSSRGEFLQQCDVDGTGKGHKQSLSMGHDTEPT